MTTKFYCPCGFRVRANAKCWCCKTVNQCTPRKVATELRRAWRAEVAGLRAARAARKVAAKNAA